MEHLREPFGWLDCLAILAACAMQVAGTVLLVAEFTKG